MKKFSFQLLALVFLFSGSYITSGVAQSNASFKYQAVIRDAEGLPIKEMDMDIRLSIVEGEEIIYSEVHTSQTSSEFGIIGLNVGSGTFEEGTADQLSVINWGAQNYMLRVELSMTDSGNGDWVTYGESPILSVPYALHAETVNDKNDADADPENEMQDLSLVDNVLSISDGNSVTLESGKDEQVLSLAGTNLSITGGNTINLAPIIGDGAANQSLSLDGTILKLENGGEVDLGALLVQENLPQNLSLDGTILNIDGGAGVDLASLSIRDATDDQRLTLDGFILKLDNGGEVDLENLIPDGGTDNQNLEGAFLSGTELTIQIEGGDPVTVDLASAIPPGGTDNQELSYDEANNTLTLRDGGSVDLSELEGGTGADDQMLTRDGTIIKLEDGGEVDLASLIPPGGTDNQELSYDEANNTLTLRDGGSVDLSELEGGTGADDQMISRDGTKIILEDGGEIDLAAIIPIGGTDDQAISRDGTRIILEDGGEIDLASVIPVGGTDDQTISYDESTNILTLEDGGTVDLTELEGGTGGTDDQTISYDEVTNILTLEDGGTVDLTELEGGTGGTDDQVLSRDGTIIKLEDGGEVDLSSIIPPGGTDNQELSYNEADNVLTLRDGGSVDLSELEGGTGADDQMISRDGTKIILEDGGEIDLAAIIPVGGTDDQAISRDGTRIILEDGGEIDLASVIPAGGTDDQALSYDESTNILTLEDGGTVDLTELEGGTGGTDDQLLSRDGTRIILEDGGDVDLDPIIPKVELANATLDGTNLILELENGNAVSVDLSSLRSTGGTDNQSLEISSDILSLERSSVSVDLSEYRDADKTTHSGILLGDGTDVSGLSGTTDGQVPKWNASSGRWIIGDDETASGGSTLWSENRDGIYFEGGKVGVGTSNPTTNMEISGEGVVNHKITSTDAGATSIILAREGDANLDWNITGTQDMIISYSENDGSSSIIHTEFENDGNLSVYGGIKSRDLEGTGQRNVMADANGSLIIGSSGDDSSLWTENGSAINYINGNVGIGIESPTSPLHIVTGNQDMLILESRDDNGWIRLNNNEGRLGYLGMLNNEKDVEFGTSSFNETGNLHLSIGGAPKLTAAANGNIGIGTQAPNTPFHIRSNSTVSTPQLKIEEDGKDYARLEFTNSNPRYWHLAGFTGDTQEEDRFNLFHPEEGNLISVQGNGNVSISSLRGSGTRNVKADLSGNLVADDNNSIFMGSNLFAGEDIVSNSKVAYFPESGTMGAYIDIPNGAIIEKCQVIYSSASEEPLSAGIIFIRTNTLGDWAWQFTTDLQSDLFFGIKNQTFTIDSPKINLDNSVAYISFYSDDWDDKWIMGVRIFYK